MHCECGENLDNEFCLERLELHGHEIFVTGHCNKCSLYHHFHWWQGEDMVTLAPLESIP